MGVRARAGAVAAAAVVSLAAFVPATSAQGPDTLDLLGTAIESLQFGDDAAYAGAVAELRSGGHWLPTAAWQSLEDRDEARLVFLWLLVAAPGDEPLTFAFDQLLAERNAIELAPTFGAADLAFLSSIDDDGVAILEVIDQRRIGISPEARTLLGPLPADVVSSPPSTAAYDQVLAMMSTRLRDTGSPLPDVDGLDQMILDRRPGPPPGAPPGDAVDVVKPGDPDTVAVPADAPDTPNAPERDTERSPAPVDQLDASPYVAGSSSPSRSPIDIASDLPATGATAPRAGLDPVTIVLAGIAGLGVALAVVSMRRTRRSDHLADIAFTDALTGLSNRRRLDRDLADEIRHGGRPTSVLMIDVDHFKQFNDTHGHSVGDDVLRTVGAIIARNVRKDDLPYRYGGEEFSVLLPDTHPDEASDVGERVRRAIECAHVETPSGTDVSITASVGLSSGPADQVNHLVQRADQALYIAKANGRNRVATG